MTHSTHYTNHWFSLVCDLLMSQSLKVLSATTNQSKTSVHESISGPLYSKWLQPYWLRYKKHFQFAKTCHTQSTP